MKPNLETLKKNADKINKFAMKILKRNNLPTNLDLAYQIENQIEYFNLLNQLKAKCKKKNLKVLMLTLVVYHRKTDSLEKVYKILKSATSKLFHLVEYRRFEDLIGVQDFIKKLEIDFNDAIGWHPHFHILLICENSITIEFLSEYEKKFSNRYLQLCINSGMSKTQKIKEFMTESGLNLINNFDYLGYVSDYKKLLKPRIEKLQDKYFSPYQMPLYFGYKEKFKEFAKFIKNKKIFEFSRPSICEINFTDWKEVDKTTRTYKPTEPNLSELQDYVNSFYEIQNRKWSVIYEFLPDKMLKHYCVENKNINYKKFKLWLCYVSNVDWWNFYNYVKQNFDADLFSTKRRTKEIPELVKTLIENYEEFYICTNLCDPYDFLSKSQHQLIKEFESWSR